MQVVKYGVVQTSTLAADLAQWDALYCAGRLHKPGVSPFPLYPSTHRSSAEAWDAEGMEQRRGCVVLCAVAHLRQHAPLQQPLQNNLAAAVGLALLQLPASFDTRQLLTRICEISYLADVRMAFAEDSRKARCPASARHPCQCPLPLLFLDLRRLGPLASHAHGGLIPRTIDCRLHLMGRGIKSAM